MTQDTLTILSLDDEAEIAELIAAYLHNHGYRVLTASSAAQADSILAQETVDLLLLDLMMPGEDGLSVCRRLRADPRFTSLPIIMLTAMGEDIDRIIGLEVGADDYIAKPFNPRELLARIKAVLRRSAPAEPQVEQGGGEGYSFAGWHLDTSTAQLSDPQGQPIELTAGEYNLLLVLLEAAPRVLSRDHLLDVTVGREATPFDRSVDIQVSRLRAKIEPNPKAPSFIKTIRSQGYAFAQPVTRRRS